MNVVVVHLRRFHVVPVHGLGVHHLLHQPEEELSPIVGGSSVEAEGELVEVVVEVVRADGALVGSKPPPLEKRGDTVDARHQHMGEFVAAADIRDLVPIAPVGQARIGAPTICMN